MRELLLGPKNYKWAPIEAANVSAATLLLAAAATAAVGAVYYVPYRFHVVCLAIAVLLSTLYFKVNRKTQHFPTEVQHLYIDLQFHCMFVVLNTAGVTAEQKCYSLLGIPVLLVHRFVKLPLLVTLYSLVSVLFVVFTYLFPTSAGVFNAVYAAVTILNQSAQQMYNINVGDKFILFRGSMLYFASQSAKMVSNIFLKYILDDYLLNIVRLVYAAAGLYLVSLK